MSARVLEVDVTFDLRGATGAGGRRRLAFDAPAGVTAVVGPSGVGKSTALDVLAGLAPAAAGTVRLGGRVLVDVARRVQLPPDARRLGVVLQGLWLFPDRTARANVAFGASGTAAERAGGGPLAPSRARRGTSPAPAGQLSGGRRSGWRSRARPRARSAPARRAFTALHPGSARRSATRPRARPPNSASPSCSSPDEGEAAPRGRPGSARTREPSGEPRAEGAPPLGARLHGAAHALAAKRRRARARVTAVSKSSRASRAGSVGSTTATVSASEPWLLCRLRRPSWAGSRAGGTAEARGPSAREPRVESAGRVLGVRTQAGRREGPVS